jgi:hypothetical protein
VKKGRGRELEGKGSGKERGGVGREGRGGGGEGRIPCLDPLLFSDNSHTGYLPLLMYDLVVLNIVFKLMSLFVH